MLRKRKKAKAPPPPPLATPAAADSPQWRQAEVAMARWLISIGFPDAEVTQGVHDGGIDVVSAGLVCQVKRHRQPVPAASLQQLVGAAVVNRATPLFFSSINMELGDNSGYAKAALAYATKVNMACFVFDAHTFKVSPANVQAQIFLNATAARSADPAIRELADRLALLSAKRRQSRRRRRSRRRLETQISEMISAASNPAGLHGQ